MKVAAFATVKLNSERVPRKNIQPIGNKPLCGFSLIYGLFSRGEGNLLTLNKTRKF